MKKSVLSRALSLMLILVFTVTAAGLAGCGAQQAAPDASKANQEAQTAQESAKAQEEKAGPVTLSVGLLAEDLDFFQAKTKEDSFKNALPNVTIDFQQYKDTEEMIKNQKIRQAANELPDVIYMKPDHLLELKNSLVPWSEGEELVKQNKYVKSYAINSAEGGGYYGIPMKVFSDWVYYKPSIFKELNLQVPTTWGEFIDTAKAVKAGGKYIPIAMGAKDTWPTYPFNEWMPHVISNNPNILTDLARQDEPFGPDSAFYKTYAMVDQLYKADVLGKALGTSWSEAEQLMASNKAAMMATGQFYLPDYKKLGGDMSDIAVFPLPFNTEKVDGKKAVGLIDLFFGVSKTSKNLDTAKKYVAWFFGPEVYKAYIDERMMTSTVEGIDASNIFAEAIKEQKVEIFMYIPGDENYTKLAGDTKWETKTIGTQMMAGKDYKAILADYNKKWKAARAKLGIK